MIINNNTYDGGGDDPELFSDTNGLFQQPFGTPTTISSIRVDTSTPSSLVNGSRLAQHFRSTIFSTTIANSVTYPNGTTSQETFTSQITGQSTELPYVSSSTAAETVSGSSTLLFRLLSSNDTSTAAVATNNPATIILEPDFRVHYPVLAILLSLICVVVVFGNGLTMLAICKERYLRTVTNFFVASLAFADCLVGAIVMPFSIVHEVMNKWWIFGQDLCDLWHSFDVLASTASILNLCVISLDRYWAITDPMTYPSRMTPRKAFLFILGLWLCSALISFPAIAWWRAVQKQPPEPYRCTFTDDVGYLVFSSIISFYGPLTIMIMTYYRIYVVASEQTRSLKLGAKQIQMSYIGDHSNHSIYGDDTLRHGLTLRIHRGGGASHPQQLPVTRETRSASNTIMRRNYSQTSDDLVADLDEDVDDDSSPSGHDQKSSKNKNNNTNNHSDHYRTMGKQQRKRKDSNDNGQYDGRSRTGKEKKHNKNSSNSVINHLHHGRNSTLRNAILKNNNSDNNSHANPKATNTNHWSVGRRLTKLAKERKAAKTLGIVMGVFILCWMPFFVTNILMGICPETCIVEPDLVFSIVTWLGWLNSAMNPIIYACWSRDFRRAFRKLLCHCFIRNSSLSYNRNRIYKAPNPNNRYNLYYKSRLGKTQTKSPIEPSREPSSTTSMVANNPILEQTTEAQKYSSKCDNNDDDNEKNRKLLSFHSKTSSPSLKRSSSSSLLYQRATTPSLGNGHTKISSLRNYHYCRTPPDSPHKTELLPLNEQDNPVQPSKQQTAKTEIAEKNVASTNTVRFECAVSSGDNTHTSTSSGNDDDEKSQSGSTGSYEVVNDNNNNVAVHQDDRDDTENQGEEAIVILQLPSPTASPDVVPIIVTTGIQHPEDHETEH